MLYLSSFVFTAYLVVPLAMSDAVFFQSREIGNLGTVNSRCGNPGANTLTESKTYLGGLIALKYVSGCGGRLRLKLRVQIR